MATVARMVWQRLGGWCGNGQDNGVATVARDGVGSRKRWRGDIQEDGMATVGRMVVTVRRMMAVFGRMVATSKTMVAARTRDVPKPQPEPCHSLEGPLGTLGRLHLCRHESDTKQTKRQKQQKHTYQQRTQVQQHKRRDSAGLSRT